MTTPEGKNKDYLLAKCKKLKLVPFKLTFDGITGAPDWMINGMGKHIFIELKAENGTVSKRQAQVFDAMHYAGGCNIYVCYTPEDIDNALKKLFTEHEWLERMF